MSDAISRQAAIDAIEREKSLVERPITETRWFDLGLGKAQDVLSELPSAQPEITEDQVKDYCRKRCLMVMSIEVFEEVKYKYDHQPERKPGRWIYGEDDVAMCDGYHCSKCGFFVPWDYKRKFIDFIKDYNYCPNCGKPMVKEGAQE